VVKIRHWAVLSLLSSIVATGCGTTDEPSPSLSQWLGESQHFAVSGKFNGEPYDVRLEGAAASSVECVRIYAPLPGTQPDATGKYDTNQTYFAMKEISATVDRGGKPTTLNVGYWRNDPAADTALQVVPRQFGTAISAGNTWADFELSDPSVPAGSAGPDDIEKAAESGTLSMKLNSGTPNPGGTYTPTGGRTGEFLDLTWGPDEHLTISTTAECKSIVAVWAQKSVLP